MSTSIKFFDLVQEDIRAVEDLMRKQADGYNTDVSAALNHLLSSGGKRMRPTITLLTGRMFGAEKMRTVTLAAAIELLHTATLVHDDLIDSALLRRGIPTLNSSWSPGATVLTGDFLFARAAKLAADTESIEVQKIFAITLTVIVDGEITQMFASRCKVNRSDYEKRIYAKTASLFQTCAGTAAVIGNAEKETKETMADYGYNIGMAFQIVDDVLDFTGEQATLGKPVGSDLRQGLVTLPVMYFVDEHPDDPTVTDLLEGRCIKDSEEINRVVDLIRTGESIQRALAEAESYAQKAIAQLKKLPECQERNALEQIAHFIVARNR